ncbi:hypothetical protein ACFLY8_05850 [Halobacteriota archaeon]
MSWDISLIVAVLAVVFVGIGLFLNWRVLNDNNTTRQLQLFNDAFENILESELNFYEHYINKDPMTKMCGVYALFNSIEKLAFFVNEKFIKNENIASYFKDSIVIWYKEVYLKQFSQEEIDDPKNFEEFKKLYQSIKSQPQK